jgi:hypothetical protein
MQLTAFRTFRTSPSRADWKEKQVAGNAPWQDVELETCWRTSMRGSKPNAENRREGEGRQGDNPGHSGRSFPVDFRLAAAQRLPGIQDAAHHPESDFNAIISNNDRGLQ